MSKNFRAIYGRLNLKKNGFFETSEKNVLYQTIVREVFYLKFKFHKILSNNNFVNFFF